MAHKKRSRIPSILLLWRLPISNIAHRIQNIFDRTVNSL